MRVIRMGLHAQQEVEARALAGPYHPAFRQLVESRVFLWRLEKELVEHGPGAYHIAVRPDYLSTAQGQGKSNIKKLGELGYQVAFIQDKGAPVGGFTIKEGFL